MARAFCISLCSYPNQKSSETLLNTPIPHQAGRGVCDLRDGCYGTPESPSLPRQEAGLAEKWASRPSRPVVGSTWGLSRTVLVPRVLVGDGPRFPSGWGKNWHLQAPTLSRWHLVRKMQPATLPEATAHREGDAPAGAGPTGHW